MTTPASPAAEPEQEQSPALLAWLARRDRLAAIDITRTLEALEATPNQDRDRHKWKLPGVGNIIVKKQSWLNGNLQLSGHGSVRLVMHALDFQKDTEAMKWLADRFPEELQGEWTPPPSDREDNEERSFTPPDRVDQGLDAVQSYLIDKRGLPPTLVKREIASGRLYATQHLDYKTRQYDGEPQCVFIGPSSAEIRSTEPDGFKGCCDGSDSERSGYQVMFQPPFEPIISMSEAAIDALSHHALHPHRFSISTNGAGRFDLQYKITLEAHRNGWKTHWSLDADDAGDIAVQRLFNALVLRDTLSAQLGVPPEQIDDWMLKKHIISVPGTSPHELFLAHPRQIDYPIHEAQKDQSDPDKIKLIHVDTGRRASATISYRVHKAAGTLKRGVSASIELSAAEIDAVLSAYGAHRDRPEGVKDWNELWKQGGHAAVQHYEDTYGPHAKVSQPRIDAGAATPKTVPTPAPDPNKISRFARRPVSSGPAEPSIQAFETAPPRFRR